LLGVCYPDRFKAVAMHSGVAPGVAHSSATALAAMRGRRHPPRPNPDAGVTWPALLVIQGDADGLVAPSNARAAATWWAAASGAAAVSESRLRRGQRHPVTLTDYKRAGRTRVRLAMVSGLGHAWSGGAAKLPFSDPHGPDAASMIWTFAAREFRRVERTAASTQSAAKQ
jgi:poly(3-hydroxybutyrate) depolymerase